MTAATKTQRDLYEAAVIERLKETGFLEIEIRTESLLRCGEGYQDEVINAGWHYWNAALSAAEPVKPYGYVYESTVRYFDGRSPQRKVEFSYTKKNISDDDIEEFEISETAVYSALSAQVQDVAGMKHVGWRWKHADTPEEGHWHYEGGTEKPDPGFRPAYAELVTFEKVYAPVAPATPDIAALEAQLKHLITTRKNKAALAAFDNDTRMWFVAQLTGTASGRVPLTEIEALVARHLPPAVDEAPVN